MIQLIITVKTRPGRVAEYISAFTAMAPGVRSEDGCIEYGLFQDSTDPRFDNTVRPDTVMICEKWKSIEALQHHTRTSPALAEFKSKVSDIKLESSYVLLVPAGVAE